MVRNIPLDIVPPSASSAFPMRSSASETEVKGVASASRDTNVDT